LLLTRSFEKGVEKIIEDRWPRLAHNYECVNKGTDEDNGGLKIVFEAYKIAEFSKPCKRSPENCIQDYFNTDLH
jgi:hypothetical protein